MYSAGLSPKGVNERAEQVIKEVMNEFRRVRDEIEKRVKNFIEEVQNG